MDQRPPLSFSGLPTALMAFHKKRSFTIINVRFEGKEYLKNDYNIS